MSKKAKKGSAASAASPDLDAELKAQEKLTQCEAKIEVLELGFRDQAEKIARWKDKCDTLRLENEMLAKAQAKFSHDKQDIVEFLNIKVSEHEHHIAALEERIKHLNHDHSRKIEKLQAAAEDAADGAKQEIDQLTSVNMKMKAELESLQDFKKRKVEMENEVESLRAQLVEKEQTYKDTIHSLERKILQDKSALKKEMLAKVDAAVTSFRRVADQQMADTTKRAIRENMAVTSQLQKMSSTTAELVRETDTLKQRCAKLKMANSLLLEAESQLAKKNYAAQRVIKLLVDKLQESDGLLEAAFTEQERKETKLRQITEQRLEACREEGEHKLRSLEFVNQDLKDENEWLSDRMKELKKVIGQVWHCLRYQEDAVMWQSDVRKAMDHLASMTESQLMKVGTTRDGVGSGGSVLLEEPTEDDVTPTGWSPEESSRGSSTDSFRKGQSAESGSGGDGASEQLESSSANGSQLIEEITKLKDRQGAFPSELLDQVEMEAADVSSSQISYVEDQAGDSQEVIAKEGNDASPSYEDALVDDASYENWEGTPSGSAGGTDQPDEFLEDGVEMKGDEELGGSSSPKPVNAEAPSSGHEDAESPASASVVPTVEQSPSELQSEQENVTVQVSNENQDVAVGESTHSLKLDTVQSSETEKVRPRSDAQSGRSATSSRRVSKASSSIPTSPPPPPPRNVRSSPMSKQTAKRPSINIAPSSPTPPPQSQNSLVDAFVQSVGEAKLGVARKDFLRCVYPDDQPGPKPNTKSTGVQTKFGLGVIIEPDVLLSEIRPWGRHAATMPRKKVGQPIVTVLPPILKIK